MQFPYRTDHQVPLFLAPMAGVSESPFRLLCRSFGADVVVSEFISSVGVARGIDRVLEDARFDLAERPYGGQPYGAEVDGLARAAAVVAEWGSLRFLGINLC